MDASTVNFPTAGRRRGRYSDTFKAEIVAACKAPGVSTAAVALANGQQQRPITRTVAAYQQARGFELVRKGNAHFRFCPRMIRVVAL